MKNSPNKPNSNPTGGKTKGKKKFPGGFLFFLLMTVLVVLTINNFMGSKQAAIGFSYELEHLVNLDLVEPQASQKVALKGDLVTFSGKFRDHLTSDGKKRYHYLEVLDQHYQLKQDLAEVNQEIQGLKNRIIKSANRFLVLSGMGVPKGGYWVVNPLYETASENHIVIKEVRSIEETPITLPNLEKEWEALSLSRANQQELNFVGNVDKLVQLFRSTALGIGDSKMKKDLDALHKELIGFADKQDAKGGMEAGRRALTAVQEMVQKLNHFENDIRLTQLRDVRDYEKLLTEVSTLSNEVTANTNQLEKARAENSNVVWYFNDGEYSTRGLEKQDPEEFHKWFAEAKDQWTHFTVNQGAPFQAPDQPLNMVLKKTFRSEEPSPNYLGQFFVILPIVLLILLLYFVFSRQAKGMGSGAMSFGKSPARLWSDTGKKITFKDVAGVDEALEELEEIVDFLKNPGKFTALGGEIPKGVLCVGPPGTGKTLIARAVAGEANRPFFSISGSDFVEMFVGVGASRIRDLFEQAKKNAPCIVFIDEIDAVGRHRGAGIGGGHDEREQTLNQLLVEMDGFDTNEGIILMAATNRPDVLDKALLRPGRFDRRIVLDLPDIRGRFEILKVHAKKVKLDDSVDLMSIARATPGASGADLRNILNEAALLAARRGRKAITSAEASEACDKVRYGKERRSLELDANEKETTAYHESGHAIVALKVDHADPVDKVTIIPRGMSLGATHFLPKKNRLSYWKREMIDQLAVLMGGRAAEEIFVKDISSGAQQDIEQATRIARNMVCQWGMSDELGNMAYEERSEHNQYLGGSQAEKHYSEKTAQIIDKEVKTLLDQAYARALKIVEGSRNEVELMTQMLIEFETLDAIDVQEMINGKWDSKEKRKRLEEAAKLQAHLPPEPPESVKNKDPDVSEGPTLTEA